MKRGGKIAALFTIALKSDFVRLPMLRDRDLYFYHRGGHTVSLPQTDVLTDPEGGADYARHTVTVVCLASKRC
jgi:hypothetical protein